ncbi:MAG: tetratricopeptide repeat protein [Prevotellaceae bacterium]|nr:tetratricopeptide repeat protein [Prevotellaceae bacterium]
MKRLIANISILLLVFSSCLAGNEDEMKKAEALAEKGETAKSLIILNQIIDRLQNVSSHKDSMLLLDAYQLNAENYRLIGNRNQAISYFRKAIDLAMPTGDKARLAKLYNNVFGIYYALREYDRAEDLLQKSLELNLSVGDSVAIRNGYNNMGLLFYERGEFKKALENMNNALAYSDHDDRVGRSLIHTNRGEVFHKQNKLGITERELSIAMRLQAGCRFEPRMAQTLLNMTLVKAKLGKRKEALVLEDSVYKVIPKLPILMQTNSYEQMADVHFILGDSLAALRDIIKYQKINDSLRKTNNDDQLQQLLVAYDADRLKQNNSNLQETVSLYRMMITNRNIMVICVIVFLLVLFVLLVALWRRMKADKRKNRLINEQKEQLLRYEQMEHSRRQKELSMEIDHKNRQLTSYTLDLAAVNEFHQKTIASLEALREEYGAKKNKNDNAMQGDVRLREVISGLKHFNDKSLGEDFRVYFDEVHPEFLKQLSLRYPRLSKSDLRLCAYLHLGMSTKEIAALTFKEIRSIESQRNRLRKKLELPPEANLQDFLNKVQE